MMGHFAYEKLKVKSPSLPMPTSTFEKLCPSAIRVRTSADICGSMEWGVVTNKFSL